ncbi:hypothetical protein niasHT_030717 [Heterodera trifolii]|uniref:Uncharacterized protein n=1 Tax=Heterodera trifolii TaxID=157864 RepID=A0ABD2HTZ3_9BILA
MEQQNITYYPTEIVHGQTNGDSQEQFHREHVFHSDANVNFHATNDTNFGGGARRAAFRPSQLQQRQQHIVVQQGPTSIPQRVSTTNIPASTAGQQTVHVQLVPHNQQGNSPIPGQQQQQRQQIVVQHAPTSMSQRISTTSIPTSTASGQQTVHLQLVPQQGNSPIPGQQQQQQQQQQHIIISAQPVQTTNTTTESADGNPIAAFMEYFVEQQQQPTCSTNTLSNVQTIQQYGSPVLDSKFTLKNKLLSGMDKSSEKAEREAVKRARQAEAARQRYHKLTPEQKKELNLKRTEAQKRKKQREKEVAELESILRASNDIVDDPEVLEQLREKRMRAKWAEAARTRYHRSVTKRMSEDERRSHNLRRRMKQAKTEESTKEIVVGTDDETQRRLKEQNAKKAESARQRYHRMSTEEKKLYNQRRTEAFRRRRMEEEALLAMPIGRINGEALDRAQQIVIRNAKRAEAARLRYQRMTPEQRRAYNQKRYMPKRKRDLDMMMSMDSPLGIDKTEKMEREEDEFDALSSLERDVQRRTQQAQQTLRQRQWVVQQQTPSATTGHH